MFSILMAVTNVAQGVGMAVCGGLADAVGFRWTFAITTAINLLALPFLSAIFKRAMPQT